MKIQDGVYAAHLLQSEVKLSSNGKPIICFLWKLDEGGETIKSFVHLTLKDGSPNLKGIGLVRKWAPGWDGEDLYWFSEHAELARTYAVKLTVVNEPAWNDPGRIYTNVKWVNPAGGYGPPRTSAPTEGDGRARSPSAPLSEEAQVTEMSRGEFRQHLDAVDPTMSDVWKAFRILFADATQTALEQKWFALIDSCRPEGRDVDQFEEKDWKLVLAKMAIM